MEMPQSLPGPRVTAREPATMTASSGMTSRSPPAALLTVVGTTQVVDRRGAVENGAGAKHGAALDHGPFIDAAIPADEDLVFDDDGHGADGLDDTADLAGGGTVTVLTDLGAASHQSVGIDHGAFAYVSAYVDI